MKWRMRTSRLRSTAVTGLLVAGLAVVGACTPTVKVSSNYDPNVDFFEIGSFTWGGIESNRLVSGFDVRRLENALQQELVLQGYQQRARGDVLAVAYLGVVPGHKKALEYSHGLYWTETKKNFQIGNLVLDIIDVRTNRLIWRGTAAAKVEPDVSLEKHERNIRRVARKLVSQFPPPDQR